MKIYCSRCSEENVPEARFCTECGNILVPTRELRDINRVVITGMGVISCFGFTLQENWEALLSGKSGVGPTSRVPNIEKYEYDFSCQVQGFDAGAYMDKKEARRMTGASQYALAAAKLAHQDACLASETIDTTRAGVVVGTAAGGSITETERAMRDLLGGRKISPILFNSVWPNLPAFSIARTFNYTGYNSTVVTACASGTQSLATAAEVIRLGHADLILAGGTEAYNCEVALAGYYSMGILSKRRDAPEKASRPFDKDRDGMVAGEGAAFLVLENLAHARARGARIYAEILGSAIGSEARHDIAPTASSQARTMSRAIASAGLTPRDIDYINPHATSTPIGDRVETEAIKSVFGEYAYEVPISATKSMTGHMIGAAGAFEAMVCVLSIGSGWIHPTINYETPDPECDLDYVPNQARQVSIDIALSNSFGLGGQNASLILGRVDAY